MEFRVDELPTCKPWYYIPLYKLTNTGEMNSWQIGSNCTGKIIIKEEDNIDEIEVENGKEIYEARKAYRKKYKEGYRPAGSENVKLIKGMKGHEYKTRSIKKEQWPVYTQPKINGIRMLCNEINKDIKMRSWLNNEYKNLTHLKTEIEEFFQYLPKNSTLDGELYNHQLKFNDIVSAVKTVNREHKYLKYIKYYIFDIDYESNTERISFEKRYELLVNAYTRYVEDREIDGKNKYPETIFIVQCSIAIDENSVISQHDEHVKNGYEGIMIKKISNGYPEGSKFYNESLYKQSKCNNILKYKNFRDDEGKILLITKVGNYFEITLETKQKSLLKVLMSNINQNSIGKDLTYRIIGNNDKIIGVIVRDYE